MADSKKQVRPGGPHGRGHGYQRPQDLRGTVGKLLGYIGRYKGALIVVAVCLILSSVGSVASSYFLKPALNHIVAGDFKGLFWMLVAMGGVFLASAGCSYAYSRLMVRISQRTVATLRQDLFNRLQTLPLRYFDTHQSGDLMSRFTNDMDTVSDMIGNSFASVVSNLITFVCTVFMLIYLNWALTLITFVFLGLMLLVVKSVGGRSRVSFQQQQAALGSLNGYIEEMIEGQKVIKVFHHEQKTMDEFAARNSAYRDAAAMAQTYAGSMMPAMGNLSRINYAVTCCVGGGQLPGIFRQLLRREPPLQQLPGKVELHPPQQHRFIPPPVFRRRNVIGRARPVPPIVRAGAAPGSGVLQVHIPPDEFLRRHLRPGLYNGIAASVHPFPSPIS